MADEKNPVWICCYSKRIQRLPQKKLNSTHPFSNNCLKLSCDTSLQQSSKKQNTWAWENCYLTFGKTPVINFWPNQDAKKAKRWMMKPHPVISRGHTINFSRDLKAPRPGFNTRNVFGTLKISTTVKYVVKQMSNYCHLWVTDTWKVQQQKLSKVSNIPLLSLYFNYKSASQNS